MWCHLGFDEDEEPIKTESIYPSCDENENSTPFWSPEVSLAGNYYDFHDVINQLKASQNEQWSASDNTILQCPPTPTTSPVYEDEQKNFNCIRASPRHTPYVPERCPNPIENVSTTPIFSRNTGISRLGKPKS